MDSQEGDLGYHGARGCNPIDLRVKPAGILAGDCH